MARPWAAIVSSPLGRAVETATLLAVPVGAPVLPPEPALREYDFGEWDGLMPRELEARGFWRAVQRDPEFAPPGGEGFAAAARRLAAALDGIAAVHTGQRVIVVTHGLALAAALALVLTGNVRNAARYTLPNGGLALLDVASAPRLLSMDGPTACEIGM